MVARRSWATLRYGKILLGKLSNWLATDLGTVLFVATLFGSLLTFSVCSIAQTHKTTGHERLVDQATVQAYRPFKYYPASFEPEDSTPVLQETPMSINKDQLREKIKAVLTYLDPEIPYSETAVELLMLTCAQETHLGKYLKQVKGPARGIFQIEPNTEKDMWKTLAEKKSHAVIRHKISLLEFPGEAKGFTNMEMNLAYQIAMARYYYYRIPMQLPDSTIQALATYWKKYYNTYLGAGTVEEAVANYNRFC